LREILQLLWSRFKIIAAIIGDVQARMIMTVFYYTILVPFGFIAHFFIKPLEVQTSGTPQWLERPPIPSDLETAKRQG
jgi:hypothetical protein